MKHVILSVSIWLFSAWLTCDTLRAQTDSSLYSFSFIQYNQNFIEYPEKLTGFFQKLQKLTATETNRVNMLHIGDSHLQAGFISEKIRAGMQERFGDAGRGLIFPYKVAGSNSPSDVLSASNVEWESKRCVFPAQDLPIGLSGFSIKNSQAGVYLKMGLKDVNSAAQWFDEIRIFHKKGADQFDLQLCYATDPDILKQTVTSEKAEYYTVRSGDYLGRIAAKYGVSVGQLKAWNHLRTNMIRAGQKLKIVRSVKQAVVLDESRMIPLAYLSSGDDHDDVSNVKLNYPISEFYLKTVKSDSAQKEAVIYGAQLSKSNSRGVLYNLVGVNGAMYEHFNQAERFQMQLQSTHPDLIILSLGTNEAHSSEFDFSKIYSQVEFMIQSIQRNNPEASILLCSPPETHKPSKYVNPNSALMADLLRSAALNNNCAYWNFYGLMGGHGSMLKWQTAGLAQKDRVHLSKQGYYIQGQLLLDALLSAYDSYTSQ